MTPPDHTQRLRPLIRYPETHYANPPTLAEAVSFHTAITAGQ